MGDKILIVGGAGYIGSHVALAFGDLGAQVTVFDNLSTGQEINLLKGHRFIKGDLLNPADLDKVFKESYNGVVHLAALKAAGESMTQPEAYAKQNLVGSLNLLERIAQSGAKLIFSSTAAVYGTPVRLPMDETHPVEPINFYGYTKLQIEGYMGWYHQLRGLEYAALRYFNAAGYDAQDRIPGLERNPQNLIPLVMEVAKGIRAKLLIYGDDYETVDGTGVRDYIHVSDLARAHVAAYQKLKERLGPITVNLGTGRGYSVLEVVRLTEEISGKPVAYEIVGRREGDPPKVFASSAKAKDLMGWEAKESSLRSMLETTWNLYKKL